MGQLDPPAVRDPLLVASDPLTLYIGGHGPTGWASGNVPAVLLASLCGHVVTSLLVKWSMEGVHAATARSWNQL